MTDIDLDMLSHYEAAGEERRLSTGTGRLEFARTCELLDRFIPAPPATILDVGGGPGAYACVLAARGYEVHLVDSIPLHVEQAHRASARQPNHPLASVTRGDARRLDRSDASVDVVLMFGPLYHLTERADRLTALCEVRRTLASGGLLMAAGISRFASTLDGLARHLFDDPGFAEIAARDLADGQHRNPGNDPNYFTTAFFHHPEELRAEIVEGGFDVQALIAIEGPGWILRDFDTCWEDPPKRDRLMSCIRAIESEPSMLGVSAHIMAVARGSGSTATTRRSGASSTRRARPRRPS